MSQKCPKCGAAAESGEDFCGQCGGHLWESEPAAADPGIEVPAPEPPPSPQPETQHSRSLVDRVKAVAGMGPAEMRNTADQASTVDAKDMAQTQVAASDPETQAGPSAPPAPAGGDPAEALVVPVQRTGPRGPAPVKPASPAPPPKPAPKQADEEPIRPGDLICGECGVGNAPTRKFCRRCGHDLKEAVVARVAWWRRVFAPRPNTGPEVGTRPMLKPPRRWPKRLVALVAVLGLLGGGLYLVRDRVRPAYEAVLDRINGSTLVATTSVNGPRSRPRHDPEMVRDEDPATYWSPRRDVKNPTLTFRFARPTRIVFVRIYPGASGEKSAVWRALGSPEKIAVVLTRSDKSTRNDTINLRNAMGKQDSNIATSDVEKVELVIKSSYEVQKPGTAIAWVQFYQRE